MPKASFSPAAWRQEALRILESHLTNTRSAVKLADDYLARYQQRAITHGWRVTLTDRAGTVHVVDVLADKSFPYSAPRLALAEGQDKTGRPHVESDDALCIFPTSSTIWPRDPIGVVEELLSDGRALIDFWLDDESAKDFENEFLSYWSFTVPKGNRDCISLITPDGPSRTISVWRGKRFTVFADNRGALERWLRHLGSQPTGRDSAISDGVLLWLPSPMRPDQYPSTSANVLALAKQSAEEGVSLMMTSDAVGTRDLDVVIGAPTPHGACFASVRLLCPPSKVLNKGFRPGHVPQQVLQNLYFSAAQSIDRFNVKRADHRWIHGRDQDPRQAALSNKRVLVLGCGSIGSGVARLLAQAGVGFLTLVDNQMLDWPNISRHALGAQAVRQSKAIALAAEINKNFPHLETEGRLEDFGVSSTSLIDALRDFDLIISATGDWAVDALLDDLRRDNSAIPPVLFGWMEAHAAASHALILTQRSNACLQCGFRSTGSLLHAVTEWDSSSKQKQEPACGATFTPFGGIDLAISQQLIADLALETLSGDIQDTMYLVGVCSEARLTRNGGRWNSKWIENNPPHPTNFVVQNSAWLKNPSCTSCGA